MKAIRKNKDWINLVWSFSDRTGCSTRMDDGTETGRTTLFALSVGEQWIDVELWRINQLAVRLSLICCN